MHPASIVIQQPERSTRLILLMHGVGAAPQSMAGVGQWLAQRDAEAMVVCVAAHQPSDISAGLQWFSVRGVTEDNRQARVDAAMPGFVAAVQHWQQVSGVHASHTLIAGFSQGAIMALESTKLAATPAAEVVAMAGRYATLPTQRPQAAIHLLHGTADSVMPVALAHQAHATLLGLGAHVTMAVAPGVGHEPHPSLLALWPQRA